MAFSSEASTPSGLFSTSTCYRDHLAKATAENKDYLKSYISGLSPDGQTFYNKALDAAFTYFDNDDMDDDGDNRGENAIVYLYSAIFSLYYRTQSIICPIPTAQVQPKLSNE